MFNIYASNLWENTHVQLHWNHTFTLLFSCKSAVYLQNTFSEEQVCVTTCENTYNSGHLISTLWKPCWSQDDVTFIKHGTKNSVVSEQRFSINHWLSLMRILYFKNRTEKLSLWKMFSKCWLRILLKRVYSLRFTL